MKAVSLYAHFPWCVRKCPYCDFNSHPLQTGRIDTEREFDEDAYIDALLESLAAQPAAPAVAAAGAAAMDGSLWWTIGGGASAPRKVAWPAFPPPGAFAGMLGAPAP